MINHRDLDRVAADGLIEAGVVAVVNCGALDLRSLSRTADRSASCRPGSRWSTSRRRAAWTRSPEGDVVRSRRRRALAQRRACVGRGPRARPKPSIEARDGGRRAAAIGTELERFAENTLEYIQQEARPHLRAARRCRRSHTKFAGRHALVVVRGHDYRTDLAALRPYIREYQPVLIGVDGGADALLELGFKPDIIIGDFDSVSADGRSHCGAELVHHVHPDGRAPGRENLLEWGVEYHEFVAEGTSEDVAMLLAYESKRAAHRRGRHPRHDGRVPRQGPPGHGVDVPHPPAARARCSSTPRA